MGNQRNKKKLRQFGKGIGEHAVKRKNKHSGRPTYSFVVPKRAVNISPEKCSIKIVKKKVKKTLLLERPLSTTRTNVSYTVTKDPNSLKVNFKKVNDTCGDGYRLINLELLQKHVVTLTLHACQCPKAMKLASVGKAPIKLVSEVRTVGLASILRAQCAGCDYTVLLETSPKLPARKRYDINVRAVWGSIVTGNGAAHLNEFLSTLDSPGLSSLSFAAIEEEIAAWWHDILEKEMLITGAEERQIAINKGNYFGEVPSVTVITDGGWSKRTHKHSYNALGGVGVIIGAETKKLLHIGVRNKYCYVCSTAESRREVPKTHKCFKNWSESSQSMEADIIVEGFKEAEVKHGVRYMHLIGDGDSSVFARIREDVPVWGPFVKKLECANHTCKCLRSKLEKLVAENPMYKGKHNLSKPTRIRIVSAVRCAIRVRSKEENRQRAVKLLRHDIRNCVHHIFGYHANCTDFCKAKSGCTVPTICEGEASSSATQDPVSDVMEEQVLLWTEGTSVEAQEESRLGSQHSYSSVENFIIKDVLALLSPIADKSERLIGNTTTNLAESWMHIRTKFDGGKVYHLCNRGSWHGRCYGGALRMNAGPQWSPKVWKLSTGTEPGRRFKQHYNRREAQLKYTRKHKAKPETAAKRWKRKMSSFKQSVSKKARRDYGPEAVEVTEDVPTETLEEMKATFKENNIDISSKQIDNIETATKTQSQSAIWHSERKKRITASNFGAIVRRNPSIPVKNLVKKLLYSTFKGTRQTRNGLLEERNTIDEYKLKKAEEKENVSVNISGLVINKENKFLAGSPDGVVETTNSEKGLLEIKNLYHDKPINLWQAAESKPNFCLTIKDGTLKLRDKHDYYYQCHGLMNVCQYPWIDFVVRTLNPYQMHIERLYRNKSLWEDIMLPKLESFYNQVLLAELASPREGKSPGIREPGKWYKSPAVPQGKATRKRPARSCSSTTQRKSRKLEIQSTMDSGSNTVTESATQGKATKNEPAKTCRSTTRRKLRKS